MSVHAVAELIQRRNSILVFTGAGISTGSGIPDFRGPQGVWKKWRPVYYQEFMTSEEARIRHWRYKLEGWQASREARPNAAHQALGELEQMGKLLLLVTQNIDGLHQQAGNSEEKVVELHGTNRWVECQSCSRLLEPDPVFEEFARTQRSPRCDCGGFLKPATISFGQQLPLEKLTRAFDEAQKADLVLSIGSTLEVEPAASVPRTAKECGADYVILNQGTTAHDPLADLRLEGDVTLLLPAILEHLKTLEGGPRSVSG